MAPIHHRQRHHRVRGLYPLSATAFTRPNAIYCLVRHNHAHRPSRLSRRTVRLHFTRTGPPTPRCIGHLGYPCLTLPDHGGNPTFLVNRHLPAQHRGPPLLQTPDTGFIVPGSTYQPPGSLVPTGPLQRDFICAPVNSSRFGYRVKTKLQPETKQFFLFFTGTDHRCVHMLQGFLLW